MRNIKSFKGYDGIYENIEMASLKNKLSDVVENKVHSVCEEIYGKLFELIEYMNMIEKDNELIYVSELVIGENYFIHDENGYNSWEKPVLMSYIGQEGGVLNFKSFEKENVYHIPISSDGLIKKIVTKYERNKEFVRTDSIIKGYFHEWDSYINRIFGEDSSDQIKSKIKKSVKEKLKNGNK